MFRVKCPKNSKFNLRVQVKVPKVPSEGSEVASIKVPSEGSEGSKRGFRGSK